MTHKNDKKVNKMAECNLLQNIINPPKCTNILIAITLLFSMDVWILLKLKKSLRNFEFYWTVDVVPQL